ncbi:MAG: phage/plasmid primase, P4 family, partial [Candidatus Saccharimonadales bacterium]
GMNSAGYIAGVRTIYESRVLVNNNLFDADPWQLNTSAGLIDCKTGAIDTHSTLRYCTKATAVAPDPSIDITPWLDMIAAHDGSEEWMNYHQRVAFYCLTGSTAHDAIFVLQGPPGTGKSSFFGTLGRALGDYSTTVKDSDMFLVNKIRNEHPTEFADFAGSRIIVVDELPKGAVLNTTLLNKMTSGTGKARFMRQDYFQYTIQHKVTFTTNYEPRFKSLRDGFVRRVHMIPWWTQPATINTKLRDEILPAILPGILYWALQGRESYLRLGLEKPKAVADYTAKYLVSQNTIQQWIDARCELNPKEKSRSGETFNDWKSWAEDNGHYVGDISEFKANLLAVDGIGYDEDWRGRYYTGFKLKPSFPSSAPDAEHWKQSEQPINVNG